MQGEFQFAPESRSTTCPDGLAAWREQRQRDQQALAQKIGLPIGAPVEVWLKNSIRLRGILRLRQEWLITSELRLADLPLEVDSVSFYYKEIESCVRRSEA